VPGPDPIGEGRHEVGFVAAPQRRLDVVGQAITALGGGAGVVDIGTDRVVAARTPLYPLQEAVVLALDHIFRDQVAVGAGLEDEGEDLRGFGVGEVHDALLDHALHGLAGRVPHVRQQIDAREVALVAGVGVLVRHQRFDVALVEVEVGVVGALGGDAAVGCPSVPGTPLRFPADASGATSDQQAESRQQRREGSGHHASVARNLGPPAAAALTPR